MTDSGRTVSHEGARTEKASIPSRGSEPQRSSRLPYLAIALGIPALGLSTFFVRWAAAPGPVTAFYRMGLASLVLAPALLPRRGNSRPWPRAGLILAALGGLFLAADLALWNTSVNLTSAANASLLGNCSLLWVALAAGPVFGEKLTARFWLGFLIALAGVAAVASADFVVLPKSFSGDLLALIGGISYAGYYLVTQSGRQYLDSLTYIGVMSLTATILLLPVCLVLREPLAGYSRGTYLDFLSLALITQVCGYLIIGYALGHLRASLVASTMLAQPVFTALVAIPLLGEHLSTVQCLGGITVISGIILVHRSRQGE
ncbi:MAG: DMT family transporter [Anaerolineales bacterium]|jgi:drug/metabolite transporter (DMT)-like permease